MTPDGYQFGVLGTSDEEGPADGRTILDYDQELRMIHGRIARQGQHLRCRSNGNGSSSSSSK
jgi:hypothetical protein